MDKRMKSAVAAAAVAMVTLPAAAETAQWRREGSQVITVTDDGGKLMCTRASDGFEMCNGMTSTGAGTWGGPKMKHPDMPGFMTFQGTVVMNATHLKIEGCVLGGAVCDSEVWTRN